MTTIEDNRKRPNLTSISSTSSEIWQDEVGRPIVTRNDRGRFICPWENVELPSVKTIFSKVNDRVRNSTALKPEDEIEKKKFLPSVDLSSKLRAKWEDCDDSINIRWLGHATCLVRLPGGFTILTDPVFSKHCGPYQMGMPRYVAAASKVEDLPPVDAVLISNDHYDHLDLNSLKEFHKRDLLTDRGRYFIPLGTKTFLLKEIRGLKAEKLIEMEWWQHEELFSRDRTLDDGMHGGMSTEKKKLVVTCAPVQNWCGRGPRDKNERLWCSWAVRVSSFTNEDTTVGNFFFAGNTGMPRDFPLFKIIGLELGPFDLSAIPIGTHAPEEVMSSYNCSTEEAVNMHIQLKSRFSCGILWGTWALANERYYEPVFRMKSCLERRMLSICRDFFVLKHGDIGCIPLHDESAQISSKISGRFSSNEITTLHPIFAYPQGNIESVIQK